MKGLVQMISDGEWLEDPLSVLFLLVLKRQWTWFDVVFVIDVALVALKPMSKRSAGETSPGRPSIQSQLRGAVLPMTVDIRYGMNPRERILGPCVCKEIGRIGRLLGSSREEGWVVNTKDRHILTSSLHYFARLK
ncbi:hypothetical protein PHYBLDRAFT_151181 [Phycomyces blakesleeanus NRRL 1555(-)]|uniref:Uncharacterized protein n=1 Tax=Phycomyces blakesleeanus (strain ATCC 8743b / DSM 1359 / FGSC 10004 / NBRC 33097 / NRRL 1555) TaxID=763407 RepID=A0A162TJM9_PHYB8|nr:hypothetical protein PHYBLDRAFT_151181 [Phycomyces blakesleeanus NRRL 1555(-)]OAD67663.1 hypothetical protein PHYBLDRAFT_151181 [Phycomyces blakesleeanus NRRL 1555(-)]|eukprot:XP_018285703.1 hypothetical protein PHYBLDRAFT_151181 [Phycomyces blakesleeanus NRRL 1555(-)]